MSKKQNLLGNLAQRVRVFVAMSYPGNSYDEKETITSETFGSSKQNNTTPLPTPQKTKTKTCPESEVLKV